MELRFDGRADDPGAVVVVFLRGGADGLSLTPPVGDDDYHRLRPWLRLRPSEVIPLDGFFGLHPLLRPLEALFREGHLQVVPACGSDDGTRSHFEAQDRMEQGGGAVAGGWLGRWLRTLPSGRGLPAVAFGTALPLSLRGAPGAVVVRRIEDLSLGAAAALRSSLAPLYEDDALLGPAARDALQAIDRLEGLGAETRGLGAYPDDPFGAALRQTVRLLGADVGLRAASLDLPGWDSHAGQATVLEPLLRSLGAGLAALARDLGPRLPQVSVVVMTEFGRRVAENSALGTDHGRGGVMLVLGGGTPGGIAGRWPSLRGEVLEGPGDVPVAQDYRSVLRDVLARHGAASHLARIFPS